MHDRDSVVVCLDKDTTLRWPCRAGDLLLWMRWRSIWADPKAQPPNILDFWELRDGDFVTITNRVADLPAWFTLHPTETRNALAHQMMLKLKAGYQPGEIMDGPNLWRLRSGDRVVWVGESRPGYQAKEHLLAILDCHENALLIGETTRALTPLEFATFGAPSKSTFTAEEVERGRHAVTAVQALGTPRTYYETWQLE